MARVRQKKKSAKPAGKQMATKPVGNYANPGNHVTLTRTRAPSVVPSSNGRGMIVCNTEKSSTYTMVNTGTTSSGLPLNPAAFATFPWLSSIARNYTLYRWKKLIFSYVPICGTTTAGSVEMALFYEDKDYNQWLAAAAISAQNISTQAQYAFGPPYAGGQISTTTAGNSAAWFGLVADTSAAHRKLPWFSVNPSSSNDADRNLSTGVWLVAQTFGGSSAATGIGSLFITYEIELIEPTSAAFNT